jgi:hypothetical protein
MGDRTPDEIGALDVRTRGAKSGVCELDAGGLVPLARIPATLTGKDADTVDGLHASQIDADKVDGKHAADLVIGSQNSVTASRSLGTVYQNTTGKTMLITVSAYTTDVGVGYFAETDGSNPPVTRVLRHDVPASYYQSIFFIVLPGNYYKVDFISGTKTLGYWIEWY